MAAMVRTSYPGCRGSHRQRNGAQALACVSVVVMAYATNIAENCPAINDPDVFPVTLRFPETEVPAEETTYMCLTFRLPTDGPYHLVATRPIFDNVPIVHHILVQTCEHNVSVPKEPFVCPLSFTVLPPVLTRPGCSVKLTVLDKGARGECYPPEAGFRMGTTGLVTIQLHWNNPNRLQGLRDSSGMVLYLTARLRPYDMGQINVGQRLLSLPPGRPLVSATATCTSACTRFLLRGPIHVTSVLPHMHRLGARAKVVLYRPRQNEVITINDRNPWNYSAPFPTTISAPYVTVFPGDVMRVICTYNTLSKNTTTMNGFSTAEEMCYETLDFFPNENLIPRGQCVQRGDEDLCFNGH